MVSMQITLLRTKLSFELQQQKRLARNWQIKGRYLVWKVNGKQLKGMSHEMDLAFDDMYG
jgi:hypothetical protein